MEKSNQKLETKRIVIYLITTFVLTITYCLLVVYPLNNGANIKNIPPVVVQLLVAAAMFFPSIGVLITRLLTKEGFKNPMLHPRFKGNLKYYFLAYFGPGLLTLLGCVCYFIVFPKNFDVDCGYMALTLEAAGAPANAIPIPLSLLMMIQVLQAFILGPILNFVTCFGEEWGWRGYLLPKMEKKLNPLPMLLVTGMIWGLWHAPLTIIGHNYGVGYWGYPFTGIFAMCCFCIIIGVFLSYITMRTRSCLPAVLAHGAINSIGAVGIYFTKDGGNPFVGPAPTGWIGGIPFIVTSVILYGCYFSRKAKEQES